MERQLVSYRIVKEIRSIENSDFLELAIIDGWQCVVKKGEFKVGDEAIYFEVDSFLPVKPEFEFLRKSCYRQLEGKEGFRIRTIKLRGQLSQGLLLPTNTIPGEELPKDVTGYFDVTKYEIPIPAQLRGEAKGNFPEFIRKTDQERIQNLTDYPEKYKGRQFEASEKLDGTSCTVYRKEEQVGVCSRNLDLKETEDNTYWKVVRKDQILEKLCGLNRNLAFQGEICGPGIQKNRLGLRELNFFLFNVYDIDNQCYLTPVEKNLIARDLGILIAPLLGYISMPESVEACLEMARGFSILNPRAMKEGVVFKMVNKNISFKAINNDYLLKHEE